MLKPLAYINYSFISRKLLYSTLSVILGSLSLLVLPLGNPVNAEEDCTYYPVIFDPELEEVTFYFCYPSTEYDTTTLWLLQLCKTYGDILTTDKVGLPLRMCSKHQADLYIQQIQNGSLTPPF